MLGFQLRPGRTIPAVASSVAAQALFRNGEQGVWYDPNDLSTLYQDSAGTTPVTAAGQPVGLMLDKRLGLVLGSEVSPPLDFTLAGWVAQGAATTTTVNSFTTTGIGGRMWLDALAQNKWYKVSVSFSKSTATQISLRLSGGGADRLASTSLSGTLAGYVFSGAEDEFYIRLAGADTATISSISIRELPGNHAAQPTAASRPILRQNATTAAYYLEFDGSDDFLVTNSIDFTLTDKVSVFAGIRKLSDLATAIVTELSASAATNSGTFVIYAPSSAGLPRIAFSSRGTAAGTASYDNASVAAPVSAVVSGVGNIGGDSSVLRVNGAQVAQSLLDQGTGNYGNYPLYIGRRAGTGLPFNGHFYGLTIVGRLCTAAETRNTELVLARRTGVTLT